MCVYACERKGRGGGGGGGGTNNKNKTIVIKGKVCLVILTHLAVVCGVVKSATIPLHFSKSRR